MGKIVKVSGPLVVATGMEDASMADVVRVGEQRLIGEVLTMNGGTASIQVYEETSGLGPGAEVVTTGAPMSVELGPGMIENIYDGIQRPLGEIMRKAGGSSLPRGVEVPSLDRERSGALWPPSSPGRRFPAGISSAPFRRRRWFSTRSWCRRSSRAPFRRSIPGITRFWRRLPPWWIRMGSVMR